MSALLAPSSYIHVGGERWDQGAIEQLAVGDLEPGDGATVAELVTTDGRRLGVRALGQTSHLRDITAENRRRSAVHYRHQYRREPSDRWADLEGLSSSAPVGSTERLEPVAGPGDALGPVSAFRVVFVNRTDADRFDGVTVPSERIGCRISGQVLPPAAESATHY